MSAGAAPDVVETTAPGGPGLGRLRKEVVPVEVLTHQGHEQIALADGASVGGDTGEGPPLVGVGRFAPQRLPHLGFGPAEEAHANPRARSASSAMTFSSKGRFCAPMTW